jgi:hypothetical protein
MRFRLLLATAAVALLVPAAPGDAARWRARSPDGTLVASLRVRAGKLRLELRRAGRPVLSAALGRAPRAVKRVGVAGFEPANLCVPNAAL